VAFGIAWLGRTRTARWLAVFAVLSLVTATGRAQESELVTRGREVYVAEGCIHCHSQYVRPDTADISRWGPPAPMTEALAAEPPLLGNRRQGPDLANVGLRRSAEWNRLHLISPSAITPGSRMPAYAHLFRDRDSRGEALVAYLATLGANRAEQASVLQDQWHPSAAVPQPREEQARLFAALCVSCHGPAGRGDGPLARQLSAPPPDFTQGWRRLSPDEADFELKLMRLIKFGLPGTPMAGHEYLRDRDVLSLAAYVETLHAPGHP
jgi:cytochrome c oxidase cbb3-type subunit 2